MKHYAEYFDFENPMTAEDYSECVHQAMLAENQYDRLDGVIKLLQTLAIEKYEKQIEQDRTVLEASINFNGAFGMAQLEEPILDEMVSTLESGEWLSTSKYIFTNVEVKVTLEQDLVEVLWEEVIPNE